MASQTVKYISESEHEETEGESEESEIENQGPSLKRANKNHVWDLIETFDNAQDAEDHVKNMKYWNKLVTRENQSGKKVYFCCKSSKNCNARLFLYYLTDSIIVELYKTNADHSCTEKNVGISKEIKIKIKELYSLGITKPKLIIRRLRLSNLRPPSIRQLNNFLQYHKTKTDGKPIIYLHEVQIVCQELSQIPENEDEPYVINYEIIEIDGENKFRFFLSTKRLLSIAEKCSLLQADATYKLLWQGYPVLIAGTSDMNNVFHPYGIGVTFSECADDFRFLFDSIKKGIEAAHNVEYKPDTILADGAKAITNGFKEVFGEIFTRMFCWAHIIKNVDHKLGLIKNSEARKEIRMDIKFIQLAKSENEFNAAKKLFLKKWSPNTQAKAFLSYFVPEYLENNDGWFEGINLNYPTTNNGLEATNRVIKSHGTFRERLPLKQFFNVMKTLVGEWSVERNSEIGTNSKIFAEIPSTTLKLITEAYKWVKNRNLSLVNNDDNFFYYISAFGSDPVNDFDIRKYQNHTKKLNWRNFKTYQESQSSIFMVARNEIWQKSSCTCPKYLKSRICHHVVGIAILLKELEVPNEAKNIVLTAPRPPGRPSKAKRALIRQ